jgi:hypothetical protein
MIFAIPTAVPAMPPKPSMAAIRAMTRKVMAQLIMELSIVFAATTAATVLEFPADRKALKSS